MVHMSSEPFAVAGTQVGLELFRLIADVIQNAPSLFETPNLRADFFRFPSEEQPGKDARWRGGRGHRGAGARPGEAGAFSGERQRGKTCRTADVFGSELV